MSRTLYAVRMGSEVDRMRSEEELRDAALAVSSARGEAVFFNLASYLAKLLGVEIAFIASRTDPSEPCRLQMRALCIDGEAHEAGPYELRGPPCETAIAQQFRAYPDHPIELCPADSALGRIGARSYASFPLIDEDGTPVGVLAVMSRRPLDVVERFEPMMRIFAGRVIARMKVEEALRASEEQYRTIFNASVDALVLRDADFRIVDANPAFFAMHGYEPAQVLGRILPPLLIDEQRPAAQAMLDKAIAGTACSGDFQSRRPDGGLLDIDIRMLPVRFRDQPHVLVVSRDVTTVKREQAQRRALESQLLQAQKMEAIGQLTGGIAHDFNNILTSVLGYIGLAAERAEARDDPHLGRQLDQARIAAQRARDLIGKMLAYSRRQRVDRRLHSLEAVVRQAVELLRPMLPTTIELRADLAEPVPAVAIDAVQIEQVLVNLCINARDATAGAGRIGIAIRCSDIGDAVCASCRARADGPWVELVVTDAGSGIAPEVMERMFDPFYTTKDVGQGSGMGLAMVHGIVHDHGGHVLVSSRPGAGSAFRICLPAAASPAPQNADGSAASTAAGRPRLLGRVLLVEDQPMVADFMSEVLASWGLEVTLHRHPASAYAWFIRNPQQVEVVITDQTMPAMTGVELAALMTSVRPDLPVLVYTGYSESLAEIDLRSAGIVALLKKPIEPAVLRTHLERVLPQIAVPLDE